MIGRKQVCATLIALRNGLMQVHFSLTASVDQIKACFLKGFGTWDIYFVFGILNYADLYPAFLNSVTVYAASTLLVLAAY